MSGTQVIHGHPSREFRQDIPDNTQQWEANQLIHITEGDLQTLTLYDEALCVPLGDYYTENRPTGVFFMFSNSLNMKTPLSIYHLGIDKNP